MSYVNVEKLKGSLDPSIPFITVTIAFTTAQIVRDFLSMFGSYARGFRIQNLDGAAALTYRLHQATEPLHTVPPNSEVEDPTWFSFIEINPNGVSGNGILEVDLVDRKIAERS